MDIGFNSDYLLDITTQLESDIVQFKLGDATQPAIVQNDNSESTLLCRYANACVESREEVR